jgi:excisionase family DNA binding protein
MEQRQRVKNDGPQPQLIQDMLHAFGRALTAEEVARVLSVSPDLIQKRAKRGSIPSFRIGTSVRFCPRKIADWIDKQ